MPLCEAFTSVRGNTYAFLMPVLSACITAEQAGRTEAFRGHLPGSGLRGAAGPWQRRRQPRRRRTLRVSGLGGLGACVGVFCKHVAPSQSSRETTLEGARAPWGASCPVLQTPQPQTAPCQTLSTARVPARWGRDAASELSSIKVGHVGWEGSLPWAVGIPLDFHHGAGQNRACREDSGRPGHAVRHTVDSNKRPAELSPKSTSLVRCQAATGLGARASLRQQEEQVTFAYEPRTSG